MKNLLSRIWFFLSYDLVGPKAVLLIWALPLLLIGASGWVNKLDPSYLWYDRDLLYWGDWLLMIGSAWFVIAFIIAFIYRLKTDGKSKD